MTPKMWLALCPKCNSEVLVKTISTEYWAFSIDEGGGVAEYNYLHSSNIKEVNNFFCDTCNKNVIPVRGDEL